MSDDVEKVTVSKRSGGGFVKTVGIVFLLMIGLAVASKFSPAFAGFGGGGGTGVARFVNAHSEWESVLKPTGTTAWRATKDAFDEAGEKLMEVRNNARGR